MFGDRASSIESMKIGKLSCKRLDSYRENKNQKRKKKEKKNQKKKKKVLVIG